MRRKTTLSPPTRRSSPSYGTRCAYDAFVVDGDVKTVPAVKRVEFRRERRA